MVNDPLRFGDLPTQQTGEFGTVVRPQPITLYNPPPPTPQPVVVDRVQYLQEQAEQRRLNAERERMLRERLAQFMRPAAQILDQTVTPQLPFLAQQAQRFAAVQQREEEERRRARFDRKPMAPGLGSGSGTGFGVSDLVDAARTNIPDVIREPAKEFVSESLQTVAQGGPLGRAISEAAERTPVLNRFEDVRQKIVNAASDAAAELVVPREVWEAAIELVPGVGTVPDIIRGVRAGAPDATRAVRQAMDSPAIRALQSETGWWKPLPTPKGVVRGADDFFEVGKPLEEGYVRLYRGEGASPHAGSEEFGGRWFSPDAGYAAGYGRNVSYVDVPIEVARSHQVAISAGKPTTEFRGLRREILLPREWSSRAVPAPKGTGATAVTWSPVVRALQSERGALEIGGTGERVAAGKIQERFRPSRTRMVPGARVFATDRNNFGQIVSTDPVTGIAKVLFRSPSGGTAAVDLPIDSLNVITQGGRRAGSKLVPLTNEQMQQAWELLPPENQRLIGVVANSSLSEAERAARLAASRGAKTGNIAEIFRGSGTPEEKLADAWAARRGADLPSQPALREFFDDSDVASYKQQIVDAANNGLVTPQEATNAGSVLDLLMTGARRNGTQTPITQGERALIGRIFGPELEKVLPTTQQKLTNMQKVLAIPQLWRSIKSGFDNSALGRQGRKMMFSDHAEWLRSIKPNLKSIQSEKGFNEVMDIVHNAEHYALGQSLPRPLGIMEEGSNLADEWLSPLTKHLPFLRPFERGYLGYLNAIRQAGFDKDVNALVKAFNGLENVPIDEIQRSADSVNNSTMFGNLSAFGDNTRVLGQTFFSARGLASAPQFHADFIRALGPNASPTMRKIIARRWAAYVGSSLTSMIAANQVGYMLNEQGVPVFVGTELNPWSSSFGEVRAGPVKFNPWGADIVPLRATLQWITGQQTPEGDTTPQSKSRNEIVGRFVQSKLSPGASITFDLVFNQGKDFQGRPIVDRPWQYAIEQASPIFWYDVQDAMREQGWWGLGDIGQVIGLDVQVYGPTKTTGDRVAKQEAQSKLDTAGLPTVQRGWDSQYWQQQFKGAGLSVDPSKYKTFDDFREAWVDHWVEQRPEGMSENEAKSRTSTAFNQLPVVSEFRRQQQEAEENFWRQHPDLLQEAIDAGIEKTSQTKDEILR